MIADLDGVPDYWFSQTASGNIEAGLHFWELG
jgi:hypothetical protein